MKRYVALALILCIFPVILFAQRVSPGTSTSGEAIGTPGGAVGNSGERPSGGGAATSGEIVGPSGGVVGNNGERSPGATVNIGHILTVITDPAFAQVFLNGEPLRGRRSVGLRSGTYRIIVRADGYQDFVTTVRLSNDMTLPVTLQPMNSRLQVNVSNVAGAQVFINGVMAGQAPFTAVLSPGSYSIMVRAPGFMDYVESFSLNGNKVINIALQSMSATYQVMTSASSVYMDDRFGVGVQVFIDGMLQNSTSGQILPGRRLIRIVSGALQAESYVDVQAGRNYVFEPFMGITVK